KPDTGKSTLEEAMTIAGTSGKFDNAAYRVSAGLHGMGAKAMNALSEWAEVEVRRNGRVYSMEFEQGYATGPLKELGPAPAGQTGTIIQFRPDPEIFGELTFNYDTLANRFREIAYLNRGLAIALADEIQAKTEHFQFQGGIAEFVEYINTGEQVEHKPIYLHKTVDNISVEIALQYSMRDEKVERCYANNAFNPDGGTHLSGYRGGLTRAIMNYGKKENIFRDGIELKGEDFREGLTVVVSIGHPDPIFESQTKVKLNNPEVDGIVSSVLYEFLSDYLEKNPKEATTICKKIHLSAEARIAAKKARDALIDRKKILGGGGLPGKLMDCTTRDRDKSELFLVEGDSAGGSAESGRDRMFQAVLPLRGKVLNVERARLEKLLKNEEIKSLIAAVGVDIGNTEEIAKVRYGKIVILTDADVDGQHIRTLLLTFFFRQMRKLIEAGHIYIARPPLFKVTQKKEVRFVQTREEIATELITRGLKDTTLHLQLENRSLTGEPLTKLLPVLDEINQSVATLERRGQSFSAFLAQAAGKPLPMFIVRFGTIEKFLNSSSEVEEFRQELSKKLGRELTIAETVPLVVDTGEAKEDATPDVPMDDQRFTVDEWHEVRGLNRGLVKLKELGFNPADLVPLPRVAGREPPVRFILENGDSRKELNDLRALSFEIRRLGEKGIMVMRFKGLGEMDPEELWDTTLDPVRRTMLRVTLQDAFAAEKMFRTLMGDEVEGRRKFIFEHRINVDEGGIDYGA
ncbi:MAG: toprim domain-containing protein, partial [Gemmataceae bacterium]